jgi:hypothetical protein
MAQFARLPNAATVDERPLSRRDKMRLRSKMGTRLAAPSGVDAEL